MPNFLRSLIESFKSPEQSWAGFLVEMFVLLAVVLFIRFYVFQFFQVSGPSMCPTLNQFDTECKNGKGEFVFVNQVTYNFIRPPERGEVVVFKPPNNNKDYYIKRVIGTPGDTIRVEDGKVYLNNAEVQDEVLREPYLSARNQGRTRASLDEFTVPAGQYLLFGDNRDRSLDSRDCFSAACTPNTTPYVDADLIKGKAEFVIWPFWLGRSMENPFEEVGGKE